MRDSCAVPSFMLAFNFIPRTPYARSIEHDRVYDALAIPLAAKRPLERQRKPSVISRLLEEIPEQEQEQEQEQELGDSAMVDATMRTS